MKLLSSAAIASALVLGAASVVATAPAEAQKKKKEEAPKVEISKEFRDAIVAGDTAAKAGDIATAETQLAAAEAVMKSEDEKYFAAQLRLQIANKKNDTPGMVRALDTLIASPKTPATDLARFNYVRGVTTLEGKQPAQALPYLIKARELGFQDPDLNLRIAGAKVDSGDLNGGIADLERAIAEREAGGAAKAPEQWYRYAASKLQAAKDEAQLAEWLRRLVRAYPTAENWRTAINIYRTSGSRGVDDLDREGRIELYRLMRATNALADQNDYILYADAANNAGLRYETVAVIDEGRASGKVPASSNLNGLYTAAKQAISREGSLATLEKEAMAAKDGKLALLAANSYLGTKQFAKAVPLYRAALQKGGVNTAAATVSLGAALAQSGQQAEAKQILAGVSDPLRKELAAFWTLYADTRAAAPAPAAAS
ncbi:MULTISPECIES: hypothetical protein [unclassified Sphingomonas]|uniref:hypothetical protein n=1 Tax=unclassified Sphingomonas TaxID=196159 RepID=UPI000A8E7F14|nr:MULTISPECIES: hypothetical protein [unclassified Sphingomonas]MCH4892669.1 hypothetical protein [Sphingomonas sp. SFZ2018-12]